MSYLSLSEYNIPYSTRKLLVRNEKCKQLINHECGRKLISTVEEGKCFLDTKISDVISEAFGENALIGTRWRVKETPKDRKSSISYCLYELIDEIAFCELGVPLVCEPLTLKEEKESGFNRYFSVKIKGNDEGENNNAVILSVEVKACEVPKKIATSPTEGMEIVSVKLYDDCSIKDLITEEMQNKVIKEKLSGYIKGLISKSLYEWNDDISAQVTALRRLSELASAFANELEKMKGTEKT